MSKYVTVSTTNTWDTKYATVSNTWAIKDTVTSYFTKCTLCSGEDGVHKIFVFEGFPPGGRGGKRPALQGWVAGAGLSRLGGISNANPREPMENKGQIEAWQIWKLFFVLAKNLHLWQHFWRGWSSQRGGGGGGPRWGGRPALWSRSTVWNWEKQLGPKSRISKYLGVSVFHRRAVSQSGESQNWREDLSIG